MATFLQQMFGRFGGAFVSWDGEDVGEPSCGGVLAEAVERVVDETYDRLRCITGYSKRLRGPMATTFRYIDELVDAVPGAMLCCRSAFSDDPRVSAFFVDPRHLQEVFSQCNQVRDLLDSNPEAGECWALLCMRKDERQRFGVSLVGDAVHREVMQTAVSFTDHQVLAPGGSEADARRSLKCCIFNGLLGYIRRQINHTRAVNTELGMRRKSLLARLKRAESGESEQSAEVLRVKMDDVERQLAEGGAGLVSLEDQLDFVIDVLGNPAQYLSGCPSSIRLSRLGIKLDGGSTGSGNEIPLFQIKVASHHPRVGVLVRFPRAELLPPQDFVRRADLFLTL